MVFPRVLCFPKSLASLNNEQCGTQSKKKKKTNQYDVVPFEGAGVRSKHPISFYSPQYILHDLLIFHSSILCPKSPTIIQDSVKKWIGLGAYQAQIIYSLILDKRSRGEGGTPI